MQAVDFAAHRVMLAQAVERSATRIGIAAQAAAKIRIVAARVIHCAADAGQRPGRIRAAINTQLAQPGRRQQIGQMHLLGHPQRPAAGLIDLRRAAQLAVQAVAGDMWRCQLAQGSQLDIGLRFALPDVEHSLQIRSLWQQAAQRGVVHHGTTAGVDQPGARFQCRQARHIEQVTGRSVQRRVQADHIAFGDDLLQADEVAALGGLAALSLLAALAAERGATLVANEVAPHRADLVRQALAAVPADAWTVRTGDGRTIADAPEAAPAFDRVLVDAPCTGLGALRRRPESRWRRTPADLAELTGLQAELLDAAVSVLAPGGVLAYVTCSPHVAETVVQVQDLVRRHPELELLDARTALDAVALDDLRLDEAEPAGAPEPGDVVARTAQLWPHRHGTDAMFLALLRAPGA